MKSWWTLLARPADVVVVEAAEIVEPRLGVTTAAPWPWLSVTKPAAAEIQIRPVEKYFQIAS
jgi:hypothetical protein